EGPGAGATGWLGGGWDSGWNSWAAVRVGVNDGTDHRSVAALNGQDRGCLLFAQHRDGADRLLRQQQARLAFVAGLAATACYLAVTVLFYYLFKPVNRT